MSSMVVEKICDMHADHLNAVKSIAITAHGECTSEEELAKRLRTELAECFGETWHVVVGK